MMGVESVASTSRTTTPVRDVMLPEDMDGDEDESWSPPDQELIDSYISLMSDRLPVIKASPSISVVPDEPTTMINPDGTVRPMTKAEKQNAKKKRRKEREKDEKAQAAQQERADLELAEMAKPVDFRLFSSRPVKQVSILPPVEDYPIPTNPRHDTLPPERLDIIRRRASEAAVLWPDLGEVESHLTPTHRSARVTIKSVRSSVPVTARMVITYLSDLPGKKTSSRGIPRIPVQVLPPPLPKKRQRSKRPRREY